VNASRSRTRGPLGITRASVVVVLLSAAALSVALAVAQEPAWAAFPGQNGRIAFVGHALENPGEIYSVSPSGARPTQLTRGKSDKASPSWSADGRRIAFVKLRKGRPHGDIEGPRQGDIYTMRADGSDQAVVTSTLRDDSSPSWSPDGRRLVFLRAIGEDYPENGVYVDRDIFVVDRDGTDLVRLTRTPEVSEGPPVWSPDGTKIAFSTYTSRDDGGAYGTIYVMKPDGSEPPEEVVSVEQGAFDLSWSPDGQWFAYYTPCGGGDCLDKVRADGTQPTFLTHGGCGPRVCQALGPEWSPDGEQLVFYGPGGLYTIDADGGNMRSIGVEGSQPSWRPVLR
jgi:Tol biopolymer transport system component